MKKNRLIALLLVLAMVVAMLCACSSSDDSSDSDSEPAEEEEVVEEEPAEEPAEEEPAEEEPAEEPTEEEPAEETSTGFTWNGQYEVWSILPTTGAEGLVMINDAMGAMMEAEGFTYVKKDAEGNPTNQVNFVEDAIAAGNVGALMIAAMSVEMLQDVVLEALDAGIAVAMLGAEPTDYGISGCVYTAYEITGMKAVEAALDWAENNGNVPVNADGKYEIALDTYYDITDGVYRSNAMVGTVESSDKLELVSETTSYGDSAFSDANANATNVLDAHPDCRIFVCYEPEEAMGTAAAVEDYCAVNQLDVADFCVIACYAEDEQFLAYYENALADPSSTAIKGYSTYGDSPELDADGNVTKDTSTLTGEHLGDILLSACGIDGYNWTYGETYHDTITATNIYGFTYTWSEGDENPAAQYKVS